MENNNVDEHQLKNVFLSYSKQDEVTYRIKDIKIFLENQKQTIKDAYIYEKDMVGGENFEKFMTEKINESQWVLFFCSDNARKSVAIGEELAIAYIGGKIRIPIFENKEQMFDNLIPLGGVQFFNKTEEDFKETCSNIFRKMTGREPELQNDEIKSALKDSIGQYNNEIPLARLDIDLSQLFTKIKSDSESIGYSLDDLFLKIKKQDDIRGEIKAGEIVLISSVYVPKYFIINSLKDYIKSKGIIIASDAKEPFFKYIDNVISTLAHEIIDKVKTDKRITVMKRDIDYSELPQGSIELKFLKISKVKQIFSDEGIRISADVKNLVLLCLDVKVEESINDLIEKVRKDRRVTIMIDYFA